MRIATWNINGLRARLDFVLHWLRERKPDIVGLQELKLADDKFPHEVFGDEGYLALTHGQKAWNGVAILSRERATLTQTGLPGQEDFGARLITADVDGLSFTTAYFPNGKSTDHDDFPKKLAWLDSVAEHFEARHSAGEDAVLCGDFNLCPEPIDSWNEDKFHGEIFHTDAERARFGRLVDWGLIDVYRKLEPETQDFSWYDYRAGSFHKKRGLRIDFLMATPSIAERVRHVEIDREYRKKQDGLTASDHCPVIADLD